MRKRSDFERMKMTPRTQAILQEVEDHGFRTLGELRQGILQSYGREWCWRIMKRLCDAHLIRPVQDSCGKHLGWSPRRKTESFLTNNVSQTKVERGRVPKYSSSFHHDMQVRWYLDQLKRLPVVMRIITESKLKRDLFSDIRGANRREVNELLSMIPDGRFTIQTRSINYEAALEVELTRKTHERIQKKLEHYIAKTNYDFVIYICADKSIYNLVKRNYHAVLANSPAVKFAPRQTTIYLALADELKADFLNAKLVGPSDSFSIGSIQG